MRAFPLLTPHTADQTATLRDLHEQLYHKNTVIATLDTKILESLDDDNEIETEIVQTNEIALTISTAKAKIIHWLTPSSAEVSTTDKTPQANLLHCQNIQ